ncbi:MAG: Hsp20/alpha crystallin family protein [Leptospiraceae bacterium]|nr:Hsp20/alpha crystallin family protein [Leptospiraceae bacterium]MDW7975623.1 Hsp20/alpha crystallin family protein [Leptospiraceae bacterium]
MKWKDLVPWKKESPESKEEKYVATRDIFDTLQKRMDELFEEFGFSSLPSFERTFYPKVDITENENEIVIKADVPGIDEKDLDVSITKDAVIIQGEKKYEHEEKGSNFYRKERSFGSFRRVLPLPVEVDEAKIDATYKNGVLTIKLPKVKTSSNVKKIQIKSS